MKNTQYSTGMMLSFDFGKRRIGVALGELRTGLARPLANVANRENPDWVHIDRLVADWSPHSLIVGKPTYEDGGKHPLENSILQFCKALEQRYALPIHRVNEALSSSEARAQLKEARVSGRRGRIRREEIDSVAAMLLLESFMNEHGNIC